MQERIRLLIDRFGMSQADFAGRIGLTPAGLSLFLSGKSKDLSASALRETLRIFNVNANWLLTGEGAIFVSSQPPLGFRTEPDLVSALGKQERKVIEEMIALLAKRPANDALSQPKNESYSHSEQREIVELGSVAAGRLNAEETPTGKKILFPRALIADRGPLYALRVRGDSMIGANIHAGDLAIFRPAPHPQELKQGSIVVALVNGENTLKRLYRADHGAILRAANDQYPDIQVQRFDDLVIQGELRYLLKKVGE